MAAVILSCAARLQVCRLSATDRRRSRVCHQVATRQTVCERPHADSPAERLRRHPCAVLCGAFNQSLRTGSVPTVLKGAYITPLIKKADLDVDDVRSYRPISNLPVLSKLLERLVSRQL